MRIRTLWQALVKEACYHTLLRPLYCGDTCITVANFGHHLKHHNEGDHTYCGGGGIRMVANIQPEVASQTFSCWKLIVAETGSQSTQYYCIRGRGMV